MFVDARGKKWGELRYVSASLLLGPSPQNTGVSNQYRWEHCSQDESFASAEGIRGLQGPAGSANGPNVEQERTVECRAYPVVQEAVDTVFQETVFWQKCGLSVAGSLNFSETSMPTFCITYPNI